MKKNLLFMTLFISVLFLSQPSFLFASKNSEARVMENENFSEDEDPIVSAAKHFGGLPKDYGFKLTKTNTIGGLKCEHYILDNNECRVFYNKKGDYVTILEDIDGFDVEPKEIDFYGAYKFHFKDGIIEGGFDLEKGNNVKKLTYKNGNIIYIVDKHLPKPNVSWSAFKDEGYLNMSFFDPIRDIDNFGLIRLDNQFGFVLSNKPNEIFVSGEWEDRDINNWVFTAKGLLINNYFYSITKDANLRVIAQVFEDHIIPCVASDSVISFNYNGSRNYEIKYANGDYFRHGENGWYGNLHRGDVIIKINVDDREEPYRVKNADGSVFAGRICYGEDIKRGVQNEWELLRSEKLYPYYGTLRFPDGRSYRYENGESEIEIKAKEEVKKKEQDAYNKAVYDAVCKKFGKRYVDAAAQGKIIIGMPEELFKASFKCSVKKREANRVCYYVYGLGVTNYTNRTTITNRVNKVVWVTNGKVSSITNR